MSIFKKLRIFSKKVTDKAKNYSADELIADSIIKASKKKDKVNAILKEKESQYRISHLELDIDFPPTVVFKINKLSENREQIQTVNVNNVLSDPEK